MKNYSTLFLSSTMLLASLIYTTNVQANSSEDHWQTPAPTSQPSSTLATPSFIAPTATNDPTIVQQSLFTQINGQELSILYNRTESQRTKTIMYAIWSEENGQDDLQWYTAGEQQTTISLTNPKHDGTYLIHSYIMVNNRLTFLEEGTFTLETPSISPSTPASQPSEEDEPTTKTLQKEQVTQTRPQINTPIVTANIARTGFINIRVDNVPQTVTEVKIPVWSVHNGQDDLVWYNATRNTDGSYGLQVDLKRHKLDTGTYAIHVYAKEQGNLPLKIITHTNIQIETQHLPVNPDPHIAIASLNTTTGTYQVQITPPPSGKSIKKIDVATWSTTNQSNIKWRVASYQNGVYTTNVDFSEHQSMNGIYHNHIYITYTDGSRTGYIADQVNLTNSRAPLKVTTTFSSQGNFRVSINNLYSSGNVSYAVWSDENGQDDIRWYNATKSGDKNYTGDIPLHFHKGTGTYHLHVYQNGKGVIPTTFQVAASQRPTPRPVIREANTYPVGQCTWGAKELAPWIPNYLGDAKYWASNARARGFHVGTSPRVGAIAVWTDGWYGHVGVVTAVDTPTRIRLKESNFNGHQYIGDFRGWFNPVSNGIVAYIYPD